MIKIDEILENYPELDSSRKAELKEELLGLFGVSHWHSWHDRPVEGSEVEVMWSDNTIDDLRYEKSAFETIDFKADIIPIKWRYACG